VSRRARLSDARVQNGWRTVAVQHYERDRGTADDQEQDAAGHRTVPANPDPAAVNSSTRPCSA